MYFGGMYANSIMSREKAKSMKGKKRQRKEKSTIHEQGNVVEISGDGGEGGGAQGGQERRLWVPVLFFSAVGISIVV